MRVHGAFTRLARRVALLLTGRVLFHVVRAQSSGDMGLTPLVFSRPIVTTMELSFLKKQTRAHKYLNNLTKAEIEQILEKHVPRLTSLHVFTTPLAPPEVYDEYLELRSRVVERARQDLQTEFQRKIRVPPGTTTEFALKFYLKSI